MTEKLLCMSCGEVIGTVSGPEEGVKRELEHHKKSKVQCSKCQAPEGVEPKEGE